MTLKALDAQHFYIDEQLIDLVWIGHHAKKQITAANYHDMVRNLRWLHKLAQRLLADNIDPNDEPMAKKRLAALGCGWYFEHK